jgi:hypothetical protein
MLSALLGLKLTNLSPIPGGASRTQRTSISPEISWPEGSLILTATRSPILPNAGSRRMLRPC